MGLTNHLAMLEGTRSLMGLGTRSPCRSLLEGSEDSESFEGVDEDSCRRVVRVAATTGTDVDGRLTA